LIVDLPLQGVNERSEEAPKAASRFLLLASRAVILRKRRAGRQALSANPFPGS